MKSSVFKLPVIKQTLWTQGHLGTSVCSLFKSELGLLTLEMDLHIGGSTIMTKTTLRLLVHLLKEHL